MNDIFLRIARCALWGALLPVSLLAGCRLYEPPIYPRTQAPPGVQTIKVLFIGNSLTYYNDLPGLVQQFSLGQEHPLNVDSVTVANVSLAFHWKASAARQHLNRGGGAGGAGGAGWDYVVLQEYSSRPADDPKATLQDYELWAPEVKKAGAKIIIAENWTHVGHDQDAPKMRQTYEQVQHEIGGEIAPMGTAFQLCKQQRPDINLYVDEKHPSVAGTYLAACILFKTLYHKPAAGLPIVIPGLKLSPDIARQLQQVADAVEK